MVQNPDAGHHLIGVNYSLTQAVSLLLMLKFYNILLTDLLLYSPRVSVS